MKPAESMKNEHLKEALERLIEIERSIVKLTEGLGSCASDAPSTQWCYPIEIVGEKSRTRYRLLRSFAAELPARLDSSNSGFARTEMEGVLKSLIGDIREHRVSQVIGDILFALHFAAMQYSMLWVAKAVTNRFIDDELQKFAEEGLNSTANSCAEIRKYPPMLLVLELDPGLEDDVAWLGATVEQAWAPTEED